MHDRLRNDLKHIVGRSAGEAKNDPILNFERCPRCGQQLDRRDFAAIWHHAQAGHRPLPREEAVRLLSIGDRNRLALLSGTAGQRAN
ncbi:MAG TPA: hypothetical protein VF495_00090 [Phenylobacterium sp.]